MMPDGAMAQLQRLKYATAVFVLAIALAAAGVAGARSVAFLALIENWILDFRIGYLAQGQESDPRIAIVGITEETLATLAYRNPVDREMLAGLIDKANRAGARAMAFDFLFDQPTEAAKDDALADAIAASSIPVVIGWAGREDGLTERQAEFLRDFAPAAKKAHVNLVRDDRDGVVREIFINRGAGKTVRPSLPIAATGAGNLETIRPLLRFRATADGGGPFPVYPAHTLAFIPDAWLADKILFVGAVLPQEDRHVTPLVSLLGVNAGTRPGVEIHAHAAAQALDRSGYKRSGVAFDFVLCGVLALVGILVGMSEVHLAVKTVLVFSVLAIVWVSGVAWPVKDGLMIPLFIPTLTLAAAAGSGAALAGRRHSNEKRFIRDAMSRYVSPDVVAELQRDPSRLCLGGERRDLTVIFTDIAGFTTTSETTPADRLVPVLNAYLDGMSGIVLRHGGMIDKYIGDAVVAIFNAPVLLNEHAKRAAACAREMNSFAQAFAAGAKRDGVDLGVTRIGVHTGPAIIGNIGGEKRFDYTAIGDTMNTAARLESANKYFGTLACVSDATVRDGADGAFRPIGELVLKGKAQGLLVHEPVEAPDEAYLTAYTAMAEGHADEAIRLLRAILSRGDDPLSRMHLERLEAGQSGVRIIMSGK